VALNFEVEAKRRLYDGYYIRIQSVLIK